MGFSDNDKSRSFAEQYTMRRESHLTSLHQKEEEMRQKFVIRVKEKESELKEAEKEVSVWIGPVIIDPLGRPKVTVSKDYYFPICSACVFTFNCPTKRNHSWEKIFCTTVDLAEWIIDDSCLILFD